MKKLLALFLFGCSLVPAGTLFLGGYPNAILVFDEAKGQVVDRIPLVTGLPTGLQLSQDHKTIYVTTNDHSGIEVLDVATRKITSHFELDDGARRYRFRGVAPDPSGKLLYTEVTEIEKKMDHYEIGKPKYAVIDLAQQKIVRTAEVPESSQNSSGGYGRGGSLEVSPDGKYLYQFRDAIVILNAADFKEVDRIPLSKPELPGMENVGFGGAIDSLSTGSDRVSLFNSSDPTVHNRIFGIAHFDLSTRQYSFAPIGPSPEGMAGLQVTPSQKEAFTVVSNGSHGNKRCEFWGFDLGTNRIARTAEFPCRSRFSFGMSANGKELYIYAAGFEIDAYDAATLKHLRTWDLNNDVTGAGMVVLP